MLTESSCRQRKSGKFAGSQLQFSGLNRWFIPAMLLADFSCGQRRQEAYWPANSTRKLLVSFAGVTKWPNELDSRYLSVERKQWKKKLIHYEESSPLVGSWVRNNWLRAVDTQWRAMKPTKLGIRLATRYESPIPRKFSQKSSKIKDFWDKKMRCIFYDLIKRERVKERL